jgi:hypothetical protein
MPTTPRYGLQAPLGVDVDNVPNWIRPLAQAMDNKMLGFSSGTLAARPAAGAAMAQSGAIYYATDTTFVYQSDGSTWRQIGTFPTVPMARFHSSVASFIIGEQNPSGFGGGGGGGPGSGQVVQPYGSPMQADYQINGFNTSAPYYRMPVAGCYRVSGQIAFTVLGNYNSTGGVTAGPQNDEIWVARVHGNNILPYDTVQYVQQSAEYAVVYQGLLLPLPPDCQPTYYSINTVRFDCQVDMTLADTDHDRIQLWCATSCRADGYNYGVLFPASGSTMSYIEFELLDAF